MRPGAKREDNDGPAYQYSGKYRPKKDEEILLCRLQWHIQRIKHSINTNLEMQDTKGECAQIFLWGPLHSQDEDRMYIISDSGENI